VVLALAAALAPAQTFVCRLHNIAGKREAGHRGRRWAGPPTSDLNRVNVYASIEDGKLYLHSNYVTRGFEHSTKLETVETGVTLADLVQQLIGNERTSGVSRSAFLQAYSSVTLYFEPRVLAHPVHGALDLAGAFRLHAIGADQVARPLRRIQDARQQRHWVVEHRPWLWAPVGLAGVGEALQALQARPLLREHVQASLSGDAERFAVAAGAPDGVTFLERFALGGADAKQVLLVVSQAGIEGLAAEAYETLSEFQASVAAGSVRVTIPAATPARRSFSYVTIVFAMIAAAAGWIAYRSLRS
jgi:hypothetical protein